MGDILPNQAETISPLIQNPRAAPGCASPSAAGRVERGQLPQMVFLAGM